MRNLSLNVIKLILKYFYFFYIFSHVVTWSFVHMRDLTFYHRRPKDGLMDHHHHHHLSPSPHCFFKCSSRLHHVHPSIDRFSPPESSSSHYKKQSSSTFVILCQLLTSFVYSKAFVLHLLAPLCYLLRFLLTCTSLLLLLLFEGILSERGNIITFLSFQHQGLNLLQKLLIHWWCQSF